MMTLAALQEKIIREYPKLLRAYVLQEEQWPLEIRINKSLPDDFGERHQLLEALYSKSAAHFTNGYEIITEFRHTRLHGMQDIPVAFVFNSREQLLGYLDKLPDFKTFSADVSLILNAFPNLKNWLGAHVQDVIAQHGHWPQLLAVLQYFILHPLPGIYARQVRIAGANTKFIETKKGILYSLLELVLPESGKNVMFTGAMQFEQRFGLLTDDARIRFRWLDATLSNQYTGGLMDISATVSELSKQHWQVPRVLILENKTNMLNAELYLSLPHLQGTMVLFGSGKALALLKKLAWLRSSQLWYWGDIDAEGFEMLNGLLADFPHVQPFCMMKQHSFNSGKKATKEAESFSEAWYTFLHRCRIYIHPSVGLTNAWSRSLSVTTG